MATFSDQFSLREVIGNLAPGAIVLSSIFYVFSKTSYYQGLISVDPAATNSILNNPWMILVIAFVTAYGIGMLLTSLTQTIFNAVTKLGISTGGSPVDTDQKPESKLSRASGLVTKLLKRFIIYLSGGQDITSTIREFRAFWQEQAVKEGVISEKAFDLAAGHYRSLLNSEPAGEESLFYCELFIRDRLPTAAIEIEQNAAKAALMGNLIIPVLCWLIAIGIGLSISIFKQNQDPPEIEKLKLEMTQVTEDQKYQLQLLEQYQSQLKGLPESQPLRSETSYTRTQIVEQVKNTELKLLELKHKLEQLGLQLTQQQQKQSGPTTVLAELLIFAILVTIFPHIVRMISRLWIEASRNYVRIIILSFTLASYKPSTEQNKMPQT
jgi:hypothetical protein